MAGAQKAREHIRNSDGESLDKSQKSEEGDVFDALAVDFERD